MKRKKILPFEGFADNPGVEKILELLEEEQIITFTQKREGVKDLMGRYNITITAPIPKREILRIDSTEDTILLDQSKDDIGSTNVFTVFNVGEQVPYIEYRGLSVNETITMWKTGEIVFPHICKHQEDGELKDALGYFILLELPPEEEKSTKTYEELYSPDKVYTFFSFLEDILDAETWRIESRTAGEITPAIVTPGTRKTIQDFLRPFYEEEQVRLDLQMFNDETGQPAVTRYPTQYITTTDKITNLAFSGDTIYGNALVPIAMEGRGSKKQITTLANIDFEQLNGSVEISGEKELNSYDRAVHNAVVSLYVEGGNEYITPQMIYQTMTGDPKARLQEKQLDLINDSLTKFMYSKLTIDMTEEAQLCNLDTCNYDGPIIMAERTTARLNGTKVSCIKVYRQPALYTYASNKNHVEMYDIKLLRTPINNTEEVITLREYLSQRIITMKGNSPASGQKSILYNTVYREVGISATTPGALKKKQAKIRGHAKTILDYWKQEGFISGYTEVKKGKSPYSINIKV